MKNNKGHTTTEIFVVAAIIFCISFLTIFIPLTFKACNKIKREGIKGSVERIWKGENNINYLERNLHHE